MVRKLISTFFVLLVLGCSTSDVIKSQLPSLESTEISEMSTTPTSRLQSTFNINLTQNAHYEETRNALSTGIALQKTLTPRPTMGDTPVPKFRGRVYRIIGESVIFVIKEYYYYCLWNPGSPPTFLSYGRPRISSDENTIAFYKQYESWDIDTPAISELWVINSDGANRRLIIDTERMFSLHGQTWLDLDNPHGFLQPFDFEWIPGKNKILFNTTGPGGSWIGLYDDLHQIDIDTGELLTVYPPGQGGKFHFSPNGEYIAIVSPESVKIVNLKTWKKINVMSFPRLIPVYHTYYYPMPYWYEDSGSILMVIPVTNYENDDDTEEAQINIWKMDITGSPPKLLSSFELGTWFWDWGGATRISPDLNKVLYEQYNEKLEMYELHVASIDGSWDDVYVEVGREAVFYWLPDSEHFIFKGSKAPYQKLIGKRGEDFKPYEGTAQETEIIEIPIYEECIPE